MGLHPLGLVLKSPGQLGPGVIVSGGTSLARELRCRRLDLVPLGFQIAVLVLGFLTSEL